MKKYLAAIVIAILLIGGGGFFAYVHFISGGPWQGTQFGLFGKPLWTPFTYTRGAYSDGTHLGYVSRGDASWFPFRFSCERELVIFTFHRK